MFTAGTNFFIEHGIDPVERDEPFGDSFKDRFNAMNLFKMGRTLKRHIDPWEGYVGPEELSAILGGHDLMKEPDSRDGEDDEGDDITLEMVSASWCVSAKFAMFNKLSGNARLTYILAQQIFIARLIGKLDWQPSVAFVLEYIEYDTPIAELKVMALEQWHFDREDDLRAQQGGLDDFDNRFDLDELALGEEMLRTERRIARCDDRKSRRSGPRARLADRRRFHSDTNRPGTQRQRRRCSSYESHCSKYGRQDERHQLPRREAKAERAWALFEREMRMADDPIIMTHQVMTPAEVDREIARESNQWIHEQRVLEMWSYEWERAEHMLTEHLEWLVFRNLQDWLYELDAKASERGWPTDYVVDGKVIVDINRTMLAHDFVYIRVFTLHRAHIGLMSTIDLYHKQLAYIDDCWRGHDDDEDNIFADYSGPDNPWEVESPNKYFEFLPGVWAPEVDDAELLKVGQAPRALVRPGTPRHQLRSLG